MKKLSVLIFVMMLLVPAMVLPVAADLPEDDCPVSYPVIGPPVWEYNFNYVWWESPPEDDVMPLPGGVVDGFCFDKMTGVTGAWVGGAAAAVGWTVGYISPTTVVFACPAGGPLTPGPWRGFFILAPGTVDGTVDWYCDHGAGGAADDDLLHGPDPAVTPPNKPGKATGGGSIPVPDKDSKNARATFGFNVKYETGAPAPTGELEYIDHTTKMNLHSQSMVLLRISDDKTVAMFTGTARVDGVSGYSFIVRVEDNGEPGKDKDTFLIRVWNPKGALHYAMPPVPVPPQPVPGIPLNGGNIQIH